MELYPIPKQNVLHKLSQQLSSYNSPICSWYICKKTLYMLWRHSGKGNLHPFHPRPDTILYISPSFSPVPFFWCLSASSVSSVLAMGPVTITLSQLYAHFLPPAHSISLSSASPLPQPSHKISQLYSITKIICLQFSNNYFTSLFRKTKWQSS